MNKIGNRLLTRVCLLLFIANPFYAYADTWRVLSTDSGRAQWQSDGGYCGALAIQKIMLKYGVWISQQEARSAGGGELLLGVNYAQALDNLNIDHKTYEDPRANASAHLLRIRTALRAGNDYIVGARTNLSWGYHTTYDHIFAVHAISGRSSGYDGNNYIYFSDSYPVGSGMPDIIEQYCTWNSFNGMNNGCDYFLDDAGQWGEEITGVTGWSTQVSLSVDLDREPGESAGSASNMYGSVHLTGLTIGKRYTIKKWEGSWKNYSGFASDFTDLHTFTANTTTYDFRAAWIGGNIAVFDIDASEGSSSVKNPQTWSDQTVDNREWKYFSFSVPEESTSLSVETSGGAGDADLYLRHGVKPLVESYDCRSWDYGNTERCEIARPKPGTWNIGVRAYPTGGDVSGLRITAVHEE